MQLTSGWIPALAVAPRPGSPRGSFRHRWRLLGLALRSVAALVCTLTWLTLAAPAFAQSEVIGWGAQVVNSSWSHESSVEIAAGKLHSAARRSDGSVVAWGSNSKGQCDLPSLPPGYAYVEIAASEGHNVARYEPICLTPTTYCTAKTNSLGCTPAIALSGPPSASAGSGCTLSTSHLLGNKNGLYVHSTAGAQALPFHGGFLCVQSPLKRHPGKNTGGTGTQCNGVLSEDLNAYIASGADPALVAGATVWLQAWSRDPAAPVGDSLSNAISALICP